MRAKTLISRWFGRGSIPILLTYLLTISFAVAVRFRSSPQVPYVMQCAAVSVVRPIYPAMRRPVERSGFASLIAYVSVVVRDVFSSMEETPGVPLQ